MSTFDVYFDDSGTHPESDIAIAEERPLFSP
jgi:hypothetical protein